MVARGWPGQQAAAYQECVSEVALAIFRCPPGLTVLVETPIPASLSCGFREDVQELLEFVAVQTASAMVPLAIDAAVAEAARAARQIADADTTADAAIVIRALTAALPATPVPPPLHHPGPIGGAGRDAAAHAARGPDSRASSSVAAHAARGPESRARLLLRSRRRGRAAAARPQGCAGRERRSPHPEPHPEPHPHHQAVEHHCRPCPRPQRDVPIS